MRRIVRKISVTGILICGIVAPGCSQSGPGQYLTPEIVRNWIIHRETLSDALQNLAESDPDLEIQAQTTAYMEEIETFVYRFAPLLEKTWTGNSSGEDNPAQLYRKILRIPVPRAVKRAYEENGLGKQGHQVFMCLLIGLFCFEVKQQNTDLSNKARKQVNLFESLIHPKDFALITEFAEDLF
ncbi:MAG: hypothetical protein LBG90_08780 [Spirochaetaceae bacterium]|jgi:hypothetical protein|nr:hypothetical protein [Spirochaetaceae bacterium]